MVNEKALVFFWFFWNKQNLPAFLWSVIQEVSSRLVVQIPLPMKLRKIFCFVLQRAHGQGHEPSVQCQTTGIGRLGTDPRRYSHFADFPFLESLELHHFTPVCLDSPLFFSHVTAVNLIFVYWMPIAQHPLTVSSPLLKESLHLWIKPVFFTNGSSTSLASYTWFYGCHQKVLVSK